MTHVWPRRDISKREEPIGPYFKNFWEGHMTWTTTASFEPKTGILTTAPKLVFKLQDQTFRDRTRLEISAAGPKTGIGDWANTRISETGTRPSFYRQKLTKNLKDKAKSKFWEHGKPQTGEPRLKLKPSGEGQKLKTRKARLNDIQRNRTRTCRWKIWRNQKFLGTQPKPKLSEQH